jgi:hypothetical protein
MEAPEGDGWSLGSLPGWFGGDTRPVYFWGLVCLGGWPPFFSLEWWGLYMVWGVWLPNSLPLEGVDRIHIHRP